MIDFIGKWPFYISNPDLLNVIGVHNDFVCKIFFAFGMLSSYFIAYLTLKLIKKMLPNINKYIRYIIITFSAIVLFTGPIFCILFTLIFTFAK